jgi:hypothetical protein
MTKDDRPKIDFKRAEYRYRAEPTGFIEDRDHITEKELPYNEQRGLSKRVPRPTKAELAQWRHPRRSARPPT